ncbi:MAG: APC family permease [Chloroflexi bacterium]|nr:MAG: APC family permease [Chloroflexota bacterium]
MAEITTPGEGLQPAAGEAAPAPGIGIAGETTLKRNTLTLPEVLAQSVANAAPSAAMALLPLLVFLNAGNGSWLAFVIAVVLMVCVGYCAAQFAKRMNSAGSFYVWVTQALGPGAGHSAGWGLQLGYVATGVATVFGFGIFGGDLLHRIFPAIDPLNPVLLIVLFAIDFLLAVAVAIYDINLSARTALTLESISILAIITLCISIWVIRGPIDTSQFTFKGVVPGGVVIGIVLAIFAFVGFESAGSLGMEAKNPYKNVGRAIVVSAIFVGTFYVLVSYSQTLGFQPTNGGYAKSSAPMPDLANLIGFGWLSYIIDIGITISVFACTLACINASARIALTMAHDGMGVPALTRTHSTRKTPNVAIWVMAVPMLAVPVIAILLKQSPVDGTGWAGTLATFGFMLAYGLVSLGAPLFLRRINQPSLPVWIVGIVGLVVMIVVFYASWLPTTIPFIQFPPLTGVYAVLPYVFFVWAAIGLIWYFVVRSRTPHVARAVGSRFETAEAHEAARLS